MARLTRVIQRSVVEQLACFAAPSEVVRVVKEEFGIQVTRQQVERYDPTKAASRDGLASEWRALFEATRRRFLDQTDGIAIAHRAWRLASLDRMARAAEKGKKYLLAAALLRQAAREVGDVYTNHRRFQLEPRESLDVLARLLDVTPDQLPPPDADVCKQVLRIVS